jgi:hypothetical protein
MATHSADVARVSDDDVTDIVIADVIDEQVIALRSLVMGWSQRHPSGNASRGCGDHRRSRGHGRTRHA